ncbi:unnamed protein product, partial [Ectocarpus fasciculatus]
PSLFATPATKRSELTTPAPIWNARKRNSPPTNKTKVRCVHGLTRPVGQLRSTSNSTNTNTAEDVPTELVTLEDCRPIPFFFGAVPEVFATPVRLLSTQVILI